MKQSHGSWLGCSLDQELIRETLRFTVCFLPHVVRTRVLWSKKRRLQIYQHEGFSGNIRGRWTKTTSPHRTVLLFFGKLDQTRIRYRQEADSPGTPQKVQSGKFAPFYYSGSFMPPFIKSCTTDWVLAQIYSLVAWSTILFIWLFVIFIYQVFLLLCDVLLPWSKSSNDRRILIINYSPITIKHTNIEKEGKEIVQNWKGAYNIVRPVLRNVTGQFNLQFGGTSSGNSAVIMEPLRLPVPLQKRPLNFDYGETPPLKRNRYSIQLKIDLFQNGKKWFWRKMALWKSRILGIYFFNERLLDSVKEKDLLNDALKQDAQDMVVENKKLREEYRLHALEKQKEIAELSAVAERYVFLQPNKKNKQGTDHCQCDHWAASTR